MKVLLLTKSDKKKYNNRINIDFLKKLSKFTELMVLPAFSNKKKRLLVDPYKVYSKYEPDVMMCHAQTPLLNGFFKKDFKCLKVVIAVDYWKIVEKGRHQFYKTNNFDLVVHRSFIPNEQKSIMNAPSVWLPWSASHKEFYPVSNFNEKIPRIGFVGTCNKDNYPVRFNAIKKLQQRGLLKNHNKVLKYYPNVLRRYVGMLSSAEKGGLLHAKTFEIMASGTIPLVNPFKGENILFEDKGCYVKYKEDMSDINQKAIKIIFDKKTTKQKSKRAREEIIKRHTDEIRIKELYYHLKNMIEGRELERKWS